MVDIDKIRQKLTDVEVWFEDEDSYCFSINSESEKSILNVKIMINNKRMFNKNIDIADLTKVGLVNGKLGFKVNLYKNPRNIISFIRRVSNVPYNIYDEDISKMLWKSEKYKKEAMFVLFLFENLLRS